MKPLAAACVMGSLSLLAGCGSAPATRPKPPIDDNVPAKLETATFALG